MSLRDQLQSALGPDYVVGRELGGGGMSRVYVVEDQRLGRTIVAKMLSPELAGAINAERFAREIRVLASLQHPNIVPLLTAGEAAGLPYFTMPYVEGESLRIRVGAGKELSIGECVSILRDMARALGYAHERGVIHRDIKPDNVLLTRGSAEVTDFGIAKALAAARVTPSGETLTQLGTSVGTPAYMSPEQAAGDPNLDHRADIYALGVVAYELLAGHAPFVGTPQSVMASHVHGEVPRITGRVALPASLERLVRKCLEKDPANRYQSADELLADLDAVSTPGGATPSMDTRKPWPRMATVAGVAALCALVWFGTAGMRRERWVRNDAIPQMRAYVNAGQPDSAWMLSREAVAVLPNDSTVRASVALLTRKAVLKSEPEGARVYRASFEDTTHWILLGTTPTDSIALPSNFGLAGRVRVLKEGYQTYNGLMTATSRTFYLTAINAADSGMAHIAGGDLRVFLVGLDQRVKGKLGDFLMDKREVTNREYKAFVDAGGYTRSEYWPAELTAGGRTFASAVAQFVDRTDRPGPASWEAGDVPSGQGDFPVGGVSWYEAKAYAKFAGKQIPTVFHWSMAANIGFAKYVVPGSNLEGKGPMRGNTLRGMSSNGVFDLAGNVREWCENDAGDGERYILGGGWSDPLYGFTDAYAQPPGDRSPINGIRLIKLLRPEPDLAIASAVRPKAFSNYAKETPVPDAVFETYRHLFDYDRAPLNAKVDRRETTDDEWIVERVSFDAAYGKERMQAIVAMPKRAKPPYQPVVFFPGSGVISQSSSRQAPRDQVESFVASAGRAFVMPILKSTFERQDSLHSDVPDKSIFWRDHVVMWTKDIRRTLDYLETRSDMDTSRIALFARSWGSNQAPISLAVEPRFKAAILYVAGLTMERARDEVDPFNYLPRVKQPVIMLDGKYDFFFPVELAQKPFFEHLGTPAANKKYIVYEGGHDVPRTELIKETLAWLDKYLGAVH